jgi:hypothetical protein
LVALGDLPRWSAALPAVRLVAERRRCAWLVFSMIANH